MSRGLIIAGNLKVANDKGW